MHSGVLGQVLRNHVRGRGVSASRRGQKFAQPRVIAAFLWSDSNGVSLRTACNVSSSANSAFTSDSFKLSSHS